MIVVTGAAGFIGSCMVACLNKSGHQNIIVVDDFTETEKFGNLNGKDFKSKVERKDFIQWMSDFGQNVEFVYHLGARTDTTEFDVSIFDELNLNFSKDVWKSCVRYDIPLVYASSAATYGLGEFGYKDDHTIISRLKPLNPYGESKNNFDRWVIKEKSSPSFWAGLKFFNVYGPNEYHKSRMASVIYHAYHQIQKTGMMKLFKSHNPDFVDGGQLRDFIYVKDVVEVCHYFMKTPPNSSGIYNVGTGKARTFLDLVTSTFNAMGKEKNISFIDTPADIRDKYQYYTQADMSKLLKSGYDRKFYSLEEGIEDYVINYLATNKYY